jgi:FkbM family methyltransferase
MTTSASPFTSADAVRAAASVVLYGAGHVGRDVLRVLRQNGIPVRCVLDQRVRGTCDGIPVYSPPGCPLSDQDRERYPVIVSVFNRDADPLSISCELQRLGFRKVVSFVAIHGLFADALGDRFWLSSRDVLDLQKQNIADAKTLWADGESRDVYRALIELRETGEYNLRVAPRHDRMQYFQPGIADWLEGTAHRFVDCGAFNGDTFESMNGAGINIEASAHFEPDLDNFSALTQTLRAHRRAIRYPTFVWPCGVGDTTTCVPFESGRGEGSRVGCGSAVTTVVALDDVLASWKPTFIKMDIEGSERVALDGAAQILADSRPNLAICLYHRPDHLWSIPLHLRATLPGYEFYLRIHAYNAFETVLYARPASNVSGVQQRRGESL